MGADDHESQPRPFPPHCRGTPLAYGAGELRVLTGPCDGSVCHGSGFQGVIATSGDPECGGFLYGIVCGDEGYIECNDCDGVIRTIPPDQLRQALNEMEAGLELAT
jgi:hypothetical protein